MTGVSMLELLYESRRGAVGAAVEEPLRRPIAVRMGVPSAPRAALLARARLLERARGPGVPVVLGFPESAEGDLGMAMPRVRGEPLTRVRARAQEALQHPFVRFSAPAWRAAAEALLGTLARAHAAQVVHAGIQPARILWGEQDGLVVLGWGLAGEAAAAVQVERTQYAARGTEGEPILLRPTGWPGASGFTAPEWLDGSCAAYAPSLDVYAAAATLWQLWTGCAPGGDGDAGEPPSALAGALRRAMDPDPARRPADADKLRRLVLASWES